MTLEEAIEKAERTAKLARDREKEIGLRTFKTIEEAAANCSDASYYKKVAEENEELAKFLKECQKYRKEKLLSERTIAKAPFQTEEHYYTGMGNTYYWFVCPCCENDVEPEPKGLEMKRKKIQTYCQYCGQRLLWAEAKELEEANRV